MATFITMAAMAGISHCSMATERNQVISIEGQILQGPSLCDWIIEKKATVGMHREAAIFLEEWFFNGGDSVTAKTSGSTGVPKQLQLAKADMAHSARRTLQFLQLEEKQAALLCLSPAFIAGKMMIVRAIVGGLDLWMSEPSSKPALPERDFSFSALVPMQLHEILQDGKQAFHWQKVKKLIIGGGAVGAAAKKALADWPNDVYETYGMTETLSHIALKKISGKRPWESFIPVPGISIGKDERGCLVIEGTGIPQGRIVTNDLVDVYENGFVFKGRIDNVINSGGIKISPEQVEPLIAPLLCPPYFIAGLPDRKFGEKVVLVIEDAPWSGREIQQLRRDLEKRLEKYAVPKEIFFLKPFVRTPTGKINRKECLALCL